MLESRILFISFHVAMFYMAMGQESITSRCINLIKNLLSIKWIRGNCERLVITASFLFILENVVSTGDNTLQTNYLTAKFNLTHCFAHLMLIHLNSGSYLLEKDIYIIS